MKLCKWLDKSSQWGMPVILEGILILLRAMLEESRRIWGVLELGQELSRAGKARSEWRLSAVMKDAGRLDEAEILSRQALVELKALSSVIEEEVTDRDFNLLLNQMDA